MIIFRQAGVYSPRYMGVNDVLMRGGRIEAVGDHLKGGNGCSEIDVRGYFLTPGLVDQHEHIVSGDGEGGSHTRTPEVQLSAPIWVGIAAVLGLLGTDDMTRSIESPITEAEGLKEEGVMAFAPYGTYGYPFPTITGNVKRDTVFMGEILGLKLALSDHRTPNTSIEELIHLASGVCTTGMISRKPRFIVLHMGDGERRLDQVLEVLERMGISMETFHPTRISRMPEPLQPGFRLIETNGYIDIIREGGERIQDGRLGTEQVMGVPKEVRNQEAPMDRITLSLDGQSSWSSYDGYGHLGKIGVTGVGNMYWQLEYLVIQGKMDLPGTLPLSTSNMAKALEMCPRKGCIAPGADADLLLTCSDMTLDTAMTDNKAMMAEGNLKKKGTYEAEY